MTEVNADTVIMERQSLLDAITGWIEPAVIANAIVDQMETETIDFTLDNGKQIWLNHLGELHHYL